MEGGTDTLLGRFLCFRFFFWYLIFVGFFWFFFFLPFYHSVVPLGFLPLEVRVTLPGENQLRQSRATQTTVHSGCFSVCLIHRTLTWTTGFLTCVCDIFTCVYTRGGEGGGVGTSVYSLIRKTFVGYRICTDFGLRGKWPTVGTQSLPRNGHPSIW